MRLGEDSEDTRRKLEGDLEETKVYIVKGELSDRRRTPFASGGLYSTAADVTAFYQMMLNGGVSQGKRLLKKKTVVVCVVRAVFGHVRKKCKQDARKERGDRRRELQRSSSASELQLAPSSTPTRSSSPAELQLSSASL